MIRVDRPPRSAPDVLNSPEARDAYSHAAEHFAAEDARSRQATFQFDRLYVSPPVKRALRGVFGGKCAFCESYVGASAASIMHHFRPKEEAVGLDGEVSRSHYWWLAYEWENLYQSCQRCAASAGAQFPVEGRRAEVGLLGNKLRKAERALLIDPCWDTPEDHLAFDDEGIAAGRTPAGEQTVDVYNLNRDALVMARSEAIVDALSAVRGRLPSGELTTLDALLAPARQYAGAIRQVVSRLLERESTARRLLTGPRRDPEWLPRITEEETRAAVETLRQRAVEPLEVESVEIHNFRGIEHLVIPLTNGNLSATGEEDDDEQLSLAEPEKKLAQSAWTMLLGENGHGKTSVLHAIALALMGERARDRLKLNADSWIRHEANFAEITVHVRGAIEPRTLRLRRDTGRFEALGDDTPAALAAYGAGRIPPLHDSGKLPRRYRVRPRIESLFDPHSTLMPARRWLLRLDEAEFDFAARALRRILLEPETSVFERVAPDVVLRRSEGPVSLDQLSDGYRSMVVLAADMMSVFHMRYGSMDAAEGIVLIDELGAHLHPRWQMRIVEAFRLAFPRLQVIATTHDPLCLRGMRDREVVVLRRTRDGRVYMLPPDEVPPVSGLRVDELLTSEVFGLNSTTDERLDKLFESYYALLASPERSAEDAERIEQLRTRLDRYRQLGSTRRERVALEAADEFVAAESDVSDPEERAALSQATRERLRKIWAGEGT